MTLQHAEPLNPSETGLGLLLLELLLLLKLIKLILRRQILLLLDLFFNQRHLIHVYTLAQRHCLVRRYHAIQHIALLDPCQPSKARVIRTSHWGRIQLGLHLLFLKHFQSFRIKAAA